MKRVLELELWGSAAPLDEFDVLPGLSWSL